METQAKEETVKATYPKGSLLLCPNGHPIYRLIEDAWPHTLLSASIVEPIYQRQTAVSGQEIRCPRCGARGWGRVQRPDEEVQVDDVYEAALGGDEDAQQEADRW